MSTNIQYPVDLPLPLRDGYGDRFEDIRSKCDMEIGTARRRRRFSVAPRLFDVVFRFNQVKYAIFDDWWENTIGGGSLPFDVQLDDGAGGLVWYTCNFTDAYKFNVVGQNAKEWRISATLRSKLPSFTTRVAGNDNLRGIAYLQNPNTSHGYLFVPSTLRASSQLKLSSTGYLANIPMRGLAGVQAVGSGRLNIISAGSFDFSNSANGALIAVM